MSGQPAPPARPGWATASGALKQVGELFDPVEAWFKPVHRFCLSCRVGVGEKHREGCPRAICACNGLKLTRCNSSYFGNRWSESDDEEQFAAAAKRLALVQRASAVQGGDPGGDSKRDESDDLLF